MPAYKDEKTSKWKVEFAYKDWTGKRRRVHKRGFERKKDALEYEREFLASQAMSPDMTFASLVELYNEDMAGRIKRTTKKNKAWLMNTHILPFFAEFQINKITPAHVRKWQSDLIAKGYKPTYLKTINNQLSAVMNYAVRFYGCFYRTVLPLIFRPPKLFGKARYLAFRHIRQG